MRNKRGQELSTNTIILIILGVIVLVILALGFFMGWDKLKGIITGGDNNVDQIAQACVTACTTQSRYDFCTRDREVKVGKDSFVASCQAYADPAGLYKDKEFGIQACPSLC
ncbi:MAG TPA: hypothetical protein VJH92_06630 [Candidatus Nanoarchaeia archaeon]|nr:hypothetical protein [Candidatus Nanoarchaeia archaeon]